MAKPGMRDGIGCFLPEIAKKGIIALVEYEYGPSRYDEYRSMHAPVFFPNAQLIMDVIGTVLVAPFTCILVAPPLEAGSRS
jgi:hypothetical protein